MSKRETGRMICRHKDGTLAISNKVQGTKDSVFIPIQCPKGVKPHAITHTHPSGNPSLSATDKATAIKHNLIICTKTDKTRCFRVKK